MLTGELNSHESFTLIPLSRGTKGGTDSFWLLTNTGVWPFLLPSCFLHSPFPCVLCPSRQADREPTQQPWDFQASQQPHILCLTQRICWGGSYFTTSTPSSPSTPRHKHKEKGQRREWRGAFVVARELEDAWLSAGKGKVHRLAFMSEWHTRTSTEASSFSTSIACNGHSTGIPCS